MKRIVNRSSSLLPSLAILLLPGFCGAQTILPQIADGGDWRTTVVLVNTTTSAASVSLDFYEDVTDGATQAWNPPFEEVASTLDLNLPAAGTMFLHTPGTAKAVSQGWGQVVAPPGVAAYAIYTYEGSSGTLQNDGTSVATSAATRVLVPFDNTSGLVTSLAVVNPTGSAEPVSVNIQTDTGVISQASIPSLAANGQIAFLTAQQFPATANARGLLEFYVSSGSIAAVSLRANPTLALTSSPVLTEIGPPIIGSTGSPGGGTLPAFNEIAITVQQPAVGNPGIRVAGPPLSNGSYSFATGGGTTTEFSYSVSWSSVTVSGFTLTFSGLIVTAGLMENTVGGAAQITSASLTVTLTPQTVATSGTVTGSITLVSALGTISGPFTGTYTAF